MFSWKFIFKVVNNYIDSLNINNFLFFNIARKNSRLKYLWSSDFAKTRYNLNSPLDLCCKTYNSITNLTVIVISSTSLSLWWKILETIISCISGWRRVFSFFFCSHLNILRTWTYEANCLYSIVESIVNTTSGSSCMCFLNKEINQLFNAHFKDFMKKKNAKKIWSKYRNKQNMHRCIYKTNLCGHNRLRDPNEIESFRFHVQDSWNCRFYFFNEFISEGLEGEFKKCGF